jgi:Ca-activated chloride channel homolog
MNVRFLNPEYAFLLVPLIVAYIMRRFFVRKSYIVFSALHNASGDDRRAKMLLFMPHIARFFCFLFLIAALMRPQLLDSQRQVSSEVIDMIFALDISRSMLAEDFQPANRLEVAKEEAIKFITARKENRFGLVIFAHTAITHCPLTIDHDFLIDLINNVHIGSLKGDGTAIGIALGTAVNRLRDSEAKSKIIILITDGENNAGQIDPITAAELAALFNIKVYTIGVGKGGKVPFPHDDPIHGRSYRSIEVKIDEKTLQRIADLTGGRYFRARDQKSLAAIYKEIDSLEKTEVSIDQYANTTEIYHWFLYLFLIFFISEILLKHLIIKTVP